MSTPLLSLQKVAAVYNQSIAALHEINFEVFPGEIVALLGSNGAGKSTTLKAVSNLLPAERGRLSAGSISFDGRSITRRSPSKLIRDGLVQVLEGRHCFKSLTVEENLITGGLGRGASRREISADLEKIYAIFPRLLAKRKIHAGLTSGGEQQMTAIGRALLARPRLLVLDEPSMGLAPLTVQDIFRTLSELNRTEKLTILLAEQNSAIALNHAHRAIVLENGRSVRSGTPKDLRESGELTALYLGGKTAA